MTREDIKTFQYRISQANASKLVVILYDMAIRYLSDVCICEDISEARGSVNKAIRVLDQLITGLDMKYEISTNLFVLYNHIKRSLIPAAVSMDKAELERVKGLLTKLREAFYEVSLQDDSAPLMKNAEAVYSGLTYSKMGKGNEILSSSNNRGFKA